MQRQNYKDLYEKKTFFLQFENTNGLSIKNPYLNSFVCLLVVIVVSGAIESDSVEFYIYKDIYRESNGSESLSIAPETTMKTSKQTKEFR